ncbi:DUF4834 domain-containing protein [Mangrovibacterium sp.]|uniref:DUF4834 domain-containing protein n=1 Tax=Mangrovibacterium sp. TaxID=1961364 RepID=UPI0035643650
MLVGLFKTFVYLFLGYYILKFVFRFLIPLFGVHLLKKQMDKQERTNQRSEGEVRVENSGTKNSNIPRNEGEYVDFEEID